MQPGVLAACWSQAVSTPALALDERRRIVQDALSAADEALAGNPRQPDITVLKALLLRTLASFDPGPDIVLSLTREADALHRSALQMRKVASDFPS